MGKDLETLAKEYVFTPLGMDRSTFFPQPKDDANVVAVHTELVKSEPIYAGDPPANAAGSLLTTADDFSKFMAVWLENMNDPIMKQAFFPTSTEDLMTCGLGWHIYRYENELIAYQYGCNPNTRSFVAVNLNSKKGAAFFTNAEHGMSLANRILTTHGLTPIGDMRPVLTHLGYSQSDEPGWQETFEGMFENNYNDRVEIVIRDGGLIYKEFGHEIKLVRVSNHEFLPEKDQSFKISFDGNQLSFHYLHGPLKILKQSSVKSEEALSPESISKSPSY